MELYDSFPANIRRIVDEHEGVLRNNGWSLEGIKRQLAKTTPEKLAVTLLQDIDRGIGQMAWNAYGDRHPQAVNPMAGFSFRTREKVAA